MLFTLLMAASAVSTSVDLDRMHVIYDAAKEICPSAYKSSHNGDEFITNVTSTSDRIGYPPQERVLLMTFCAIYAQGVETGANAVAQPEPQAQTVPAAPPQIVQPPMVAPTTELTPSLQPAQPPAEIPSSPPQPNSESTSTVQGN